MCFFSPSVKIVGENWWVFRSKYPTQLLTQKMYKSSVVISETCEICQTIFVDMTQKKNHNNVVMTDDNNTPFPCCHLFVIEAGWSLYQQAVRKGRWHFVRRTPPFCLQIIHIFGLWEEAVYVEKHLKGPRPSASKDPERKTVPNLNTNKPNLWVRVYLSWFLWIQRHEYRLAKPLAMALVSWRAIGIQSRGPGCMSSSESGRIKPKRREVHDLPRIISTAPGSPRGECLMTALSAASVSASRCHVGEKFDPKVSDNHIPSFFFFSSTWRVWDSGSWHPGTSDLSWFCHRHQSQLPPSMSGSRPKWFVM